MAGPRSLRSDSGCCNGGVHFAGARFLMLHRCHLLAVMHHWHIQAHTTAIVGLSHHRDAMWHLHGCFAQFPPGGCDGQFSCQQVWSHRSLISLVAMLAAIVVATCFVWSSLAAYLNRYAVQPCVEGCCGNWAP